MPAEVIHPVPFWQRGVYHGEWAHSRVGFNSGRHMFPAYMTFGLTMAGIYAYAERRCLYVYQKHDPRAVHLPWEKEFISKHAH